MTHSWVFHCFINIDSWSGSIRVIFIEMVRKTLNVFFSKNTPLHMKTLLSILSVSRLHSKWRHVPVSKLEHRIQKTQTYTTIRHYRTTPRLVLAKLAKDSILVTFWLDIEDSGDRLLVILIDNYGMPNI